MSRKSIVDAFVGAVAFLFLHNAVAASQPDFGKWEYNSNCAVCHGTDGKGNGPFKAVLRRDPSDLTILSRMNNGVFPLERVNRVIDGRIEFIWHGSKDMPIWGYDYMREASRELLIGIPPNNVEANIQIRISALVDYLIRLQVK